ncbi:Bug family tripartite tricarboxylate transporter substrate binding protein [Roseomonas rosulenta]|uniref:Bug family tripartite tricarboxylate transporter substrate binding protein n=1 Tax=Roseomonas rosulenta TaxID=2748667 RepID=UPI0018DEFB6D|nr:tripartite tricarboxylate transporter substrate-binding protein [Roseomonas rosulenta]
MLDRRAFLAAPLAALATPAIAQDRYPNRPIRLVIPVGVGGVTDIVGRIMAEALSPILGQPVVPENVVGAGSAIGAAAFQRLPADGYAILIATINHALMRAMNPDFQHDPVADFRPVALVSRQPFLLAVNPSVPARDMPELMAWLRAQGDAVNFGSTNPGAANHLAGELLKQVAGVNYTIVPYRTAALAVQDLVAGRVQLTIDSPSMLAPLMQAGQVRGLAVSSRETSPLLPGVPSMSQAVPGYDLSVWQMLMVRPGTPAPVVATLEAAAARALADPAVQERLRRAGVDTWSDTSAAAAQALLRAEVERWAPVGARIRTGG